MRERPAADLCELRQLLRAERRKVDRTLPVPELADVIVLVLAVEALQRAPPKQHVARGLHRALAGDHAVPVVRISALPHEALEHRLLRFLDLQHERVVLVRPLKHEDPGARTHRPHAHDLVGDVHGRVFADEPSLVGLQGRAILRQNVGHHGLEPVRVEVVDQPFVLGVGHKVAQGHDKGRVADDAQLAVHDFRQLPGRAHAVFALGFVDDLRRRLRGLRVEDLCILVIGFVDIEVGIPHVEMPHLGEPRHGLAVGAHARAHGLLALLLRKAVVEPADLDARGQALHVPLPGADERLVEVVDVEDRRLLGAREEAEVRDVGIPAGLDVYAAHGRRGEVGSHDEGASAIKGESRDRHALIAQGQKRLHARLALAAQEVDRVRTALSGLPSGVRLMRDLRQQLFHARFVRLRGPRDARIEELDKLLADAHGCPFSANGPERWEAPCGAASFVYCFALTPSRCRG